MLKYDFQEKEAETESEGEKQIKSVNSAKQLSSSLPISFLFKKKKKKKVVGCHEQSHKFKDLSNIISGGCPPGA